ncbi:Tat pathway signal sequence domain protein [Streptomyces mayonensis]|uniref:Tat pathway signal sequence domain protein n=1 Tax=Streptomyces mayonensis TaxID=2750816 RepID=UPI001C1E70C9|nr:Tat pathway signal sequence domain protein [Streptomyces sp. A108]MBU6533907.1 Tat pathway signal sequence domain protein [Streptomyces sp. A108]
MRRTILSAAALACTAVLAGTAPAFADDSPRPAASAPSDERQASPRTDPTVVPSEGEDRADSRTVPDERERGRGQVSAVPEGAADTGVASSESSGGNEGVIGAGAGAVLLAGGAAVFVVRRRRAATGA